MLLLEVKCFWKGFLYLQSLRIPPNSSKPVVLSLVHWSLEEDDPGTLSRKSRGQNYLYFHNGLYLSFHSSFLTHVERSFSEPTRGVMISPLGQLIRCILWVFLKFSVLISNTVDIDRYKSKY